MPRLPALLLLFTLAVCTLAACGDSDTTAQVRDIPFRQDGTLTFQRDGEALTTVDIEIAETDSARTRGLMQRRSLPEQSGMLFLFEENEPRSFWMANTPLSLDLFFANADSQIVRIAKYTEPFSTDQVASEAPAQYVLELPAGFADSYGIIEGDYLRWQRGSGAPVPRQPER